MATTVRHADGRVEWVPGPREKAVRDTLTSRPAGIINDAPNNVNSCFAGFFNGCRSRGSIVGDDGLFIGKAECEWNWRETWGALRDLGLIEWREETVDAPGAKGGKMTWVHLTITTKGHDVRDDDLKWFREFCAAQDADKAEGL